MLRLGADSVGGEFCGGGSHGVELGYWVGMLGVLMGQGWGQVGTFVYSRIGEYGWGGCRGVLGIMRGWGRGTTWGIWGAGCRGCVKRET